MSGVKGDMVCSADEALMKWKPVGWNAAHFCPCCCQEHAILCVDGVDGERGMRKNYCITMRAMSIGVGLVIYRIGDLPCPLVME